MAWEEGGIDIPALNQGGCGRHLQVPKGPSSTPPPAIYNYVRRYGYALSTCWPLAIVPQWEISYPATAEVFSKKIRKSVRVSIDWNITHLDGDISRKKP